MNAYQVYEQAIKPLSKEEKMAIARLIINEVVPEPAPIEDEERGFEYLKRILPQIELITVTDEDLASVKLNGSGFNLVVVFRVRLAPFGCYNNAEITAGISRASLVTY